VFCLQASFENNKAENICSYSEKGITIFRKIKYLEGSVLQYYLLKQVVLFDIGILKEPLIT